jgi:hypothetical protein
MTLLSRLATVAMLAAGISRVGASQSQTSPEALLLDGRGPWRDAAWQSATATFERLLREAGYRIRQVTPEELAGALKQDLHPLVAVPSLERLPLSTFRAVAAHVSGGGSLLAGGGEPFRQPMHESPEGKWITLQELLLRAPRQVIVNPVEATLTRSSQAPADAFSQQSVAGPDGKRDCLEVRIAKPVRLEPLRAEPFPSSPFGRERTTTVVTVRGTRQEDLLIEWREDDGLRWWARIPLTPEWKTHVLRPSDFSLPPTGGRPESTRVQFDPRRAKMLAFGLAYEVNTPPSAPVEFAVGPIAVGMAPQVEDFAVPVLETISPWYKQYDTVVNGHAVRFPIARPRGLTMAEEPNGRYEAIGALLNPAATRYVTANGATLFWIPDPGIAGSHCKELVGVLRRSANRIALLNAGPREYVHLGGEPVGFGARILNASAETASLEIDWTIRRGGDVTLARRASAQVKPGETREVVADLAEAMEAGDYLVETTVRSGGKLCDRLESPLRVFGPAAS